jgi:hypothetical protein
VAASGGVSDKWKDFQAVLVMSNKYLGLMAEGGLNCLEGLEDSI